MHGYLDLELDPAGTLALEEHLQGCAACTELRDRQQTLRTSLRASAPYWEAPPGLERRIQAALRREAPTRRRTRLQFGLATAAVLAASAAAVLLFLHSAPDEATAREVASAHVRSLLPDRPVVDVGSSNQHKVKPWFAEKGRLDFVPPVVKLEDDGFPLVGGRLDYLHDRRVAALVYMYGDHVINLFVWPDPVAPDLGMQPLTHHGYHLVHWSRRGMTFWAVSDLNMADLAKFAEGIERQAAQPP
jgi:anti-sigma factor RsiW